jgi:hypothetical protein
MPDDPALRIFPDEYVPNAEGADYHRRWVKANPAEAVKWATFRNAVIATGSGAIPVMSTKYGKALVAAGKEHMSISRLIGAMVPPYPPPVVAPPPTGTLYDHFTSWGGGWTSSLDQGGETDIFQNRWQPTNTDGNPAYIFSPPSYVGVPFSSVGAAAIQEVSTPYGGGFRFLVNPEMTQPAGGKLAFIGDSNANVSHIFNGGIGSTEDWSGKFYFPASGNPSGFPSSNPTGVLWEFHTASMSGNHIAIDPTTRDLRFGLYNGPQTYQFFNTGNVVAMDRWYSWRMRIKWAYDGTGFVQGWIDDVQIANKVGATLGSGERPWLQFGFYAQPEFSNEVTHADIRKA